MVNQVKSSKSVHVVTRSPHVTGDVVACFNWSQIHNGHIIYINRVQLHSIPSGKKISKGLCTKLFGNLLVVDTNNLCTRSYNVLYNRYKQSIWETKLKLFIARL